MTATAITMLTIFGVISLGMLFGKIKIAGITLDYAGVILIGLVFGSFDWIIPEIFQTLGLVLFVFSVGMQAGPGFLASFSRHAMRLLLPTAGMILLSVATMLAAQRIFGLDPDLALGLLTGGRSSNSALAVGVENAGNTLPALGHSLAYPIAVLAILLFVRFLPVLFKANIAEEEARYKEALLRENPPLVTKTYRVENPAVAGIPLSELHLLGQTGVNISRIMHNGIISLPQPDSVLQRGDLVKAVGLETDQFKLQLLLGAETGEDVFFDIPADVNHEAQWVLVTKKEVINQPLNRLNLRERYGATVTRLQRNGMEIPPRGTTFLRYGDKVMVVCGKSVSGQVKDLIGGSQPGVDKDFVPMFAIVSIGLLLGVIQIPLGSAHFSLGLTGGVLLFSLVMSAVGKTGKFLWVVSESSIRFSRHLGLLFFLGAVGTKAGSQILPALQNNGPPLVLSTLAISLLPLIVLTLTGRYLLKMDILTLMGFVSGSTTCSPALGIANSLTQTNAPTVAYTTAYPFAMIFMMVCVQVLGFFL